MPATSNISDITKRIKAHIQANRQVILTRCAAETVNFSLERFRQHNWLDTSPQPWKPRNPKFGEASALSTHALLIKSGALRNSIHIQQIASDHFVIASNIPYAKAHNDGSNITIPITEQMRKFAWAMYYKSGKKTQSWKALALTKKATIQFTMPRRRFLGASHTLMSRLRNIILSQLIKSLIFLPLLLGEGWGEVNILHFKYYISWT